MSTLPHEPVDPTASPKAVLMPPTVIDFSNIVREFEAAAAVLGTASPLSSNLSEMCRQVAAFTAELFPGRMDVVLKNDPEIPSDLYLVFRVCAVGSVDDLADRNDQWHRRLLGVKGRQPGLFRLSMKMD